MRLQIEQQADGSLKGYGFYTGKNRDWQMVDVVQIALRESQYVADLGEGIELIWTPAEDGSDILGPPNWKLLRRRRISGFTRRRNRLTA